jgi:hypothetical protein
MAGRMMAVIFVLRCVSSWPADFSSSYRLDFLRTYCLRPVYSYSRLYEALLDSPRSAVCAMGFASLTASVGNRDHPGVDR